MKKISITQAEYFDFYQKAIDDLKALKNKICETEFAERGYRSQLNEYISIQNKIARESTLEAVFELIGSKSKKLENDARELLRELGINSIDSLLGNGVKRIPSEKILGMLAKEEYARFS
jgi:hypothetical protein